MNLQASICLRFYFEDHSKKIFSDTNDLISNALYENYHDKVNKNMWLSGDKRIKKRLGFLNPLQCCVRLSFLMGMLGLLL